MVTAAVLMATLLVAIALHRAPVVSRIARTAERVAVVAVGLAVLTVMIGQDLYADVILWLTRGRTDGER